MKTYEKVKINLKNIYLMFLKLSGYFFTFTAIFLSFLSWEDINVTNLKVKFFILFFGMLTLFIIAFILVIFVFKSKKIWSNRKNKAVAMYSDLLSLGFNKRNKVNKIIVIPVNDAFDTIVERASETITKPLVSPNTIHGKWITKYCETNNITPEDLNIRIQKNLNDQSYKPEKTYTLEEKNRGNRDSYSLGTTAIIDGNNNVKFYLLAISKFDANNNARATKKQIRDSVDDLIDFYDKKGQGDPIYMPLMGTDNSRANMSHELSFKVIKTCILTSDIKINGYVNIVVYTGDKNKVSIYQ